MGLRSGENILIYEEGRKRRHIKLYNEELHNLYAVQNITEVDELRGIRWVRYVAYKGQTSNAYKVLFEQSEVNRPVRRLGVDRRY